MCDRPLYSIEGSTACLKCAIGYIPSYNNNSGSSSCQACSVGTYASSDGNHCIGCPEGTYQQFSGSSSCFICDKYFLSDKSGTFCFDSYVISNQYSSQVYAFVSVLVFLIICSVGFILKYRLEKTINNSSVTFLFLILVGLLFLALSAMFFATTQSFSLFEARLWCLCLGFNLIFLSLAAKLYRLDSYVFFHD